MQNEAANLNCKYILLNIKRVDSLSSNIQFLHFQIKLSKGEEIEHKSSMYGCIVHFARVILYVFTVFIINLNLAKRTCNKTS